MYRFSLRYLLSFLIVWGSSCFAQAISPCPQVMNYIQHQLPHHGVLKFSDGFVYVDISDDYIHELIHFVGADFQEPPYFGRPELVGAHITVIYPGEVKKYKIRAIQESGEIISFTPKTCQIVHPPHWEGIQEVYFVTVEAPDLEKLRKKYGLPKQEYDFHITIGVKPEPTH